MDIRAIENDSRSIISIIVDGCNGDEILYSIHGRSGITKIIPCNESGENSLILWFEIYQSLPSAEVVIKRVNGRYVKEVSYT